MPMLYFALYIILSVVFILSLCRAAKRAVPTSHPRENRHGERRAHLLVSGGDRLDITARIMDLPCSVFKSRKCFCQNELRVRHVTESILPQKTVDTPWFALADWEGMPSSRQVPH
jgi:hypothetical protein